MTLASRVKTRERTEVRVPWLSVRLRLIEPVQNFVCEA